MAVLLAALACDDGTAPDSLPPRLDLVEVDGKPLPFTQSFAQAGTPDVSCQRALTAARLDFIGNAHYVATSYARLTCDDGRPDAIDSGTEEGTVRVSGDSVFLSSSDKVASGGPSKHLWTGSRSGSDLRIYRSGSDESSVLPNLNLTILLFRAPH